MSIIAVPQMLLPKDGIDMTKWSVIACDQFTSQPKYWEQLEQFIADAPSTLKMILPEARLEQGSTLDINKYMSNITPLLQDFKGFVYVKRTLNDGNVREGIVLAIDLEAYDYSPQNTANVKATEKTVEERLPARVEIRRNAPLELPHIMLLFDDPKCEVMPLASQLASKVLYDFDLNMKGGSIKGYAIEQCDKVIAALESTKKGFLFAVGDGNHSLAAAKECWNIIKADLNEEERLVHPARFAMCEAVNLHDKSLKFEPIHRYIDGVGKEFIDGLFNLGGKAKAKALFDGKELEFNVSENAADAIADIQNYIDNYTTKYQGVCDYIHGDDYLVEVQKNGGGVAIFMPTLEKDGLFDYAARRGVLPRKSFSMGNAEDKRYYLEARKIVK